MPRSFSGGDALLLAHELVEQQQARRGRVDRHRRRDLVERDAGEGRAHVVDRVDRDARAANLAETAFVVGVEAELRRQVEGHREARRALREQVAVALVGLLRRRVAGVLAHRPELTAVHLAVYPARVRVAPGLAELELCREVVLVVERLDLDARVGESPRVVGTYDGRDREVLALCGRWAGRPARPARGRRRSRDLGGKRWWPYRLMICAGVLAGGSCGLAVAPCDRRTAGANGILRDRVHLSCDRRGGISGLASLRRAARARSQGAVRGQPRHGLAREHRAHPRAASSSTSTSTSPSPTSSTSRSTSSTTSLRRPRRSTTCAFRSTRSRSAHMERITRSGSRSSSARASCSRPRARSTATRRCTPSRSPTGDT